MTDLGKISRLKKFLGNTGGTVGSQVARGGAWMILLRVSDQLLSLVRIFALARLLSPHDFGTFGIALLALSTLNSLTVTGLREALIQYKGETEMQKNAVWTIGIIRSLLIATSLVVLAPFIAEFFNSAESTPVIQALALSVIFNGLTNIAAVYYEKELKFDRYFKFRFFDTVVNTVVAISIALITGNVWALPAGYIAGTITRVAVSYLSETYRPYFVWDFKVISSLISYGRWVSTSSILNYFLSKSDSIIVGRVFGAASLGQYELSSNISKTFSFEVSNMVGKVIFPAYALIQDNVDYLRVVFLKTAQIISLLAFPLTTILFVLAFDFVYLVLGDQWLGTVALIKVLIFFGLAASFDAPSERLFNAMGFPRKQASFIFTRLVLTLGLLIPLTSYYGVTGAALAVTIPRIIVQIIVITVALKAVKGRVSEYMAIMLVPAAASVVAVMPLLLYKYYYPATNWLVFLSSVAVSVAIYLLLVYRVDKHLGGNISSLVKEIKSFTKS